MIAFLLVHDDDGDDSGNDSGDDNGDNGHFMNVLRKYVLNTNMYFMILLHSLDSIWLYITVYNTIKNIIYRHD